MRHLTRSRKIQTSLFAAACLIVLALALPASSSAQATRTWVSGVGDDANPCSRTAPCKTFAGAISKTAAKGEINCLDPGGFGGVTITKAIAIKCHYTEGGVLVSGTNAIVINAGVNDRVTLKGLDINGIGTGLNGIRILQAHSVKIVDNEIFGFVRNAVDVSNTNALVRVVVERSHLHDNTGNGVIVTPGPVGGARVTVRNNSIDGNGCGVSAARFGSDPAFVFSTRCGTQNADADAGAATLNVIGNQILDSDFRSVFANGTSALTRIGDNTITGSVGLALEAINSGSIATYSNNMIFGNPGGNGATTATLTPFLKRKKGRM